LAAHRGLDRRRALSLLSAAAGVGFLNPGKAIAQTLRGALEPQAGSGIDATHLGLSPGATDDQSAALAEALARAGSEGRPLFLPPGRYEMSLVAMPSAASLVGVPGETRLVLRGSGALLSCRHADRFRLEGLTLDGAGSSIRTPDAALLDADDVAEIAVSDCTFLAAGGSGVRLRNSAGRIETSRVSDVGRVGLWFDQSRGIRASGNVIEECGDTGILVSRDEKGDDGTIVTDNRVSRVRADSGGTGQNGNGINLDKSNGVLVSGNHIDGCAFTAIRCSTGNVARLASSAAASSF